jgi:hypothetical protein
MKQFIATLIASILVLTAPGYPCYAAIATVVRHQAPAVNGGMQTSGRLAPAGQMSNLRIGLTPAGLKSGLMAPALTPKVGGLPSASLPAAQNPVNAAVAVPVAGPMALGELLNQKESLSLGAQEVARMPESQAKTSAASIMDRILGLTPVAAKSEDSVTASAAASLGTLPAAQSRASERKPGPPSVPQSTPSLARSRALGFAVGLLRMIASGAAVVGLQAGAVALMPSVFGLVPIAAVWAVSSGVLLLPIALYARYRLGLRDSPRLTKVKWIMDAAIGAFLGASFIAAPSLGAVLTMQHAAWAGSSLLAALAGRSSVASPLLNSVGVLGALTILPT